MSQRSDGSRIELANTPPVVDDFVFGEVDASLGVAESALPLRGRHDRFSPGLSVPSPVFIAASSQLGSRSAHSLRVHCALLCFLSSSLPLSMLGGLRHLTLTPFDDRQSRQELAHAQVRVLLLPRVERGLADAQLAADVTDRGAGLDLAEGIGDLLFGEFRPASLVPSFRGGPPKPSPYSSFDLPSFSGETSHHHRPAPSSALR